MRIRAPFRWPPEKQALRQRAIRLEWITIAVMGSATILLFFTAGTSQAMRTAFFDDLMGLVPPIAFLVAVRFERRRPNRDFPFGYYRGVSIAHFVSALTLFALGAFLVVESTSSLLRGERPSLGTLTIFGLDMWAGWVMIVALVYSTVPPVILGRLKTPIAAALHDKVLVADAALQKADWMTGIAAIAGIVGIGFGLWWFDAAAAGLIALDILYDGVKHLSRAARDLADEAPRTVEDDHRDPVVTKVRNAALALPWVEGAAVNFRGEGHLLSGVIYVAPKPRTAHLVDRAEEVREAAKAVDWRVHDPDVAFVPLDALPSGARSAGGAAKD